MYNLNFLCFPLLPRKKNSCHDLLLNPLIYRPMISRVASVSVRSWEGRFPDRRFDGISVIFLQISSCWTCSIITSFQCRQLSIHLSLTQICTLADYCTFSQKISKSQETSPIIVYSDCKVWQPEYTISIKARTFIIRRMINNPMFFTIKFPAFSFLTTTVVV